MQPGQTAPQDIVQHEYAEGEIAEPAVSPSDATPAQPTADVSSEATHVSQVAECKPSISLADCRTNIDTTTAKGRAIALNAMSPAILDISKKGVTRMKLHYYVIYNDTVVNRDTGKARQVTRTVFIDMSGTTCRTTAPHAPEFVARVMSNFSREEWDAGIPITIEYRPSRQPDRDYHAFGIDIDAL